jgi:hypothetical protein
MSIFKDTFFEHSLNEIESVNAEIEGTDFDKQTKRKKDGVFYTPQNILPIHCRQYVGKPCTEKENYRIIDEEYARTQEPPSHNHYKT